jgi:hypothetical protein
MMYPPGVPGIGAAHAGYLKQTSHEIHHWFPFHRPILAGEPWV